MEALLGTLGVAVITGLLAFCREQIKNCREDQTWYRDKLLPMLEKQQDILEKITDVKE